MPLRAADGFIIARTYGPEHTVERQVLRLLGAADFLAMKTVH